MSVLLAGKFRLCFTFQAKVWTSFFCSVGVLKFKRIGTVLYCLKTISVTKVDLHKNKTSLCPQITIF